MRWSRPAVRWREHGVGGILCVMALAALCGELTTAHGSSTGVDPRRFANDRAVLAARDSVEAMTRRATAPARPAIRMRTERASFDYLYAKARGWGWAVHVDVADTSACPNTALEQAFAAAGWTRMDTYQADGPDGEMFAFASPRVLCVVDARWDGGDDSDSTVVPDPGCTVTITCVPRRDDDVPTN
jgi:hypothetical protein